MGFRKILCPVDFSPGSDHALRLAVKLARSSQCELVISHAWYIPQIAYTAGDWMIPREVVTAVIEDDQSGLALSARTAREHGAPHVTPVLHGGPPGEQIVHLLRDDRGFDLVVIGTHGRTGLERVLLGSIAEYVLRHAPCSVLVARASDTPDEDRFRSILVPTDFSQTSRAAAELAASLIEPGGSGITVVHALELPASYSRDITMTDALGELERQSTRALEEATQRLRHQSAAPVAALSRVGRAGRAILDTLDETAYDLVCMGSHARTGMRRLVLGSVAEKTVRHASCPVLVARPREA